MFQIILIVLALFGYRVEPTPARLEKKLTLREKINLWTRRHEYELLIIMFFMMMIIFALVIVLFFPAMDIFNNRLDMVV